MRHKNHKMLSNGHSSLRHCFLDSLKKDGLGVIKRKLKGGKEKEDRERKRAEHVRYYY